MTMEEQIKAEMEAGRAALEKFARDHGLAPKVTSEGKVAADVAETAMKLDEVLKPVEVEPVARDEKFVEGFKHTKNVKSTIVRRKGT